MPELRTISCEYKLPDIADEKGYRCPHALDPSYTQSTLCIFHRPKPSKAERASLSEADRKQADAIASLFHAALLQLIKGVEAVSHRKPNTVIDMRGFYFPPIHFKKDFSVRPDFSYATFVEYGDFDTPKWRPQFKITFTQGALFKDVEFIGSANFSHTLFEEKVSFNGAHFGAEADFSFTIFGDDAEFSNSHFDLDAQFWSCKFKGSAEFDDAGFGGYLHCSHAVFQDANFFGIRAKGARFGDSVFNGPAHIFVADFETFVEFDRTRFDDLFNFDGNTMPAKTRFEKTYFGGECLFTALEIPPEASLNFVNVNLSKAQFWDTNLENIRFRDVQWASFQGRSALWDEVRPLEEGKEREYEKISENYRQLVLNYEQKRDYETAEDFHIGEMEMRRKKRGLGIESKPLRILKEWLNLGGLYRISSRYGSSYNQALVVLLICFLVISTLFLFTGFQPSIDNRADRTSVIEYNLVADSSHHWRGLQRLATDYSKAFILTLSIITFQKDRFYEPVSWQGQMCLYLAVMVLTVQAALVLLAIRRQFRR